MDNQHILWNQACTRFYSRACAGVHLVQFFLQGQDLPKKYLPNATRSAMPLSSEASAVSGLRPLLKMMVLEKLILNASYVF